MFHRRALLSGIIAAPLVASCGILMPVRKWIDEIIPPLPRQKPKLKFEARFVDEFGRIVHSRVQHYNDATTISFEAYDNMEVHPEIWCNGQRLIRKRSLFLRKTETLHLNLSNPPITVEGELPPDFPWSL